MHSNSREPLRLSSLYQTRTVCTAPDKSALSNHRGAVRVACSRSLIGVLFPVGEVGAVIQDAHAPQGAPQRAGRIHASMHPNVPRKHHHRVALQRRDGGVCAGNVLPYGDVCMRTCETSTCFFDSHVLTLTVVCVRNSTLTSSFHTSKHSHVALLVMRAEHAVTRKLLGDQKEEIHQVLHHAYV